MFNYARFYFKLAYIFNYIFFNKLDEHLYVCIVVNLELISELIIWYSDQILNKLVRIVFNVHIIAFILYIFLIYLNNRLFPKSNVIITLVFLIKSTDTVLVKALFCQELHVLCILRKLYNCISNYIGINNFLLPQENAINKGVTLLSEQLM